MESSLKKEELLPIYVQLPGPGGNVKIVFWYEKKNIEESISSNGKQGFLDIVPRAVYFDFFSFPAGKVDKNEDLKCACRLMGPLLYLLRQKPLRSIIDLDPREWEAFLRRKNSESLAEYLKKQDSFCANSSKNFELNNVLREFKYTLLLEIMEKFYIYLKHFKNVNLGFSNNNYQLQNEAFLSWAKDWSQILGNDSMVFTPVEAIKNEHGWEFLVKRNIGISTDKELFFQFIIENKLDNSLLIPINLVAVE